jgi:hypothetical protein
VGQLQEHLQVRASGKSACAGAGERQQAWVGGAGAGERQQAWVGGASKCLCVQVTAVWCCSLHGKTEPRTPTSSVSVFSIFEHQSVFNF